MATVRRNPVRILYPIAAISMALVIMFATISSSCAGKDSWYCSALENWQVRPCIIKCRREYGDDVMNSKCMKRHRPHKCCCELREHAPPPPPPNRRRPPVM
ncbi:hypothetical protein PAHAL_7G195100 [Panicum hallii]|uniref:Uncharacterized protein n=1 Tax=Panicum hallii TaxID=206008 RepID=A0A2S3I7Q0_9POAL|nr:hypothetical protein PAHAL_7G195100 [Panicum hallii]